MKGARLALLSASLGFLALSGCHQDMWEQPKVKSQSKNSLFADEYGSRYPVEGTVAFGDTRGSEAFYTGYEHGRLVREFPLPVTADLVKRGQERFHVFCLPCHGEIGDGQGMVARRGFNQSRPVASYHTDRLRAMPVGHFFDVITHGYGAMYPFGARIKPLDRWAIASYIRVLQLSQYAKGEDLDSASAALVNTQPGSGQGPLFVSPGNAPTTVPNPATPAAPAPGAGTTGEVKS